MKPFYRIVLLAAVLAAGCDKDLSLPSSTDSREQSGAADLARAKEKLAASQLETEQLRNALGVANAENASLGRKVYGLETDLTAIKMQAEADRAAATAKIQQLSRELAAAKVLPPAAPIAPVAAPPAATAQAPPATAETAALQEKVAELEARLAPLRAQVGQARAKVAALVRGTVDGTNVMPAGGMVKDGIIYRRDTNYPYNYPYNYPHYVPIGPAIKKGDFRSQQEKENAIRAAKAEATPLEMELKTLEDQLAQAKAALAKARGAGGN